MSLLEPIEQIIGTHHVNIRRILPEIYQEVQRSATALENDAGKRLWENFKLLNDELLKHMLKEEVLLFPSILEVERAVNTGTKLDLTRHNIQNPLEQMEYEHNITEKYLAEIHVAGETLNWQQNHKNLFQKVSELETDLLHHIELEEQKLFKEARRLYILAIAN